MRLAVILNRNARRVARSPALAREVALAAELAGVRAFYATASLDELEVTAGRVRDERPDVVAFAGGDGTFMAGVSALRRAYGDDALPTLAFVACGTVARVASTLGLAGPPAQAIPRLLRGQARPQRTQSLLVTSEAAERVGFIFGTGLVARFFDVYNERGAGGVPGAAAIAGRVFLESFVDGPFARRVLEPLPCELEVEGRVLPPRAWSLVACSVVRDLGLHLLVTYRAGEDPRRVHLVASPLSPRELGPRAGRVLAGKTIGGPDHFDDLVSAFTLRFPVTEHPDGGSFVLDGDVLRARSVDVRLGPTLSVLR